MSYLLVPSRHTVTAGRGSRAQSFLNFLQWISVDQWGSGVPGADKAVCFLVCHLLSASLLPLVLIILFIVVTDKFEP